MFRTYLISTPIIPYYYTQLIGDAKVPPTLLAAPTFDGFAVIGMASWFFVTNINVHDFKMRIHILAGDNTFRLPTTCEPYRSLPLAI